MYTLLIIIYTDIVQKPLRIPKRSSKGMNSYTKQPSYYTEVYIAVPLGILNDFFWDVSTTTNFLR